MSYHDKQTHEMVTMELLQVRSDRAKNAGFPESKWIGFCRFMLNRGLKCRLYEARDTFSKYITVVYGDLEFKVRFSDHKPGKRHKRDCDFYVGKHGDGDTYDCIQFIFNQINVELSL